MPIESTALDGALARELAASALTVARRLAAGATLWCVAPGRPEHARHLAVEFVHPVIVGKPAVPALSIDDPDPSGRLRSQVGPGDVVIGVGEPSSALLDVFSRTGAWGTASLWIGAGPRPPDHTVDHLLWLEETNGDAFHDGSVVLVYHLLWELTHVCIEHGVAPEPVAEEISGHCITCADEGQVAEIVEVMADGLARVRVAGVIETIDTTLLDSPTPDDLVLVHAGTAIASVDPPRSR